MFIVVHFNCITRIALSIFLILSRFRTVVLGVILACTVRSRISVSSLINFLISPRRKLYVVGNSVE